jgi:hypothetical protein
MPTGHVLFAETSAGTKVFWFFSSEKNGFLALLVSA